MAFQKLRAYTGRVKLGWTVVGRTGVMMGSVCRGYELVQKNFVQEGFVISSEFQKESFLKTLHGKYLFQARSPNDHCVREPEKSILGIFKHKRI